MNSVYTHLPKDRNFEICQRTTITRAPCRTRHGGAVFRAENFGDLMTADHKVLSDNGESRNNHRYAVVVQDLATQWIQAYPFKTKLHRKLKEVCKSFWSPNRKHKVIYTDNSLEFGKACEDLSWNHCTLTPHRSETHGEGTSAVLLQSGLKNGGQIPWNGVPMCETFKIYYLMGRRPTKGVLGNHLKDQSFRLVHWLSSIFYCEGSVKNPSIWRESLTWIVPRICSVRGENLEG